MAEQNKESLKEIVSNIKNQYFRLTIIFIMFSMLLFLLIVQKNKLILVLFLFYIFGLFFEGLIIYSLFFITLVLFFDYLYRNLKVYFVKKNIN